ncbi:hypothetical protein [Caenispirillum salinarum]|nr:hypothetical protein [Caenispirillum salinarum]
MSDRTFRFDLAFALADPSQDVEELLDPLFEAGCDDALIGWNGKGSLGATFSREADCAATAIRTGIRDVQTGAPGAALYLVDPDLVSASDIAFMVECSRQNVRKHLEKNAPDMPSPAHLGNPALWHLAEIGPWLIANTPLRIPRETLEVAREAMRINLDLTRQRLESLPPLPEQEESWETPRTAHG